MRSVANAKCCGVWSQISSLPVGVVFASFLCLLIALSITVELYDGRTERIAANSSSINGGKPAHLLSQATLSA